MITVSDLAGFFAAHAIWCLSDEERLIPIIAYNTVDDERQMERIDDGELTQAVQLAREQLKTNPMNARDAVLVYDARIAVEGGQLDAIVLEMKTYDSPNSLSVIAVPYTPKSSGQFRVHKPKLLVWDQCGGFDVNSAIEAFYEGVATHEKGAEVWERCLDGSK